MLLKELLTFPKDEGRVNSDAIPSKKVLSDNRILYTDNPKADRVSVSLAIVSLSKYNHSCIIDGIYIEIGAIGILQADGYCL